MTVFAVFVNRSFIGIENTPLLNSFMTIGFYMIGTSVMKELTIGNKATFFKKQTSQQNI